MVSNVARPELRVFRPPVSNGRALMSIPGGGYGMISVLNEGLQVAERMTRLGYTVFVLTYRLPREGWNLRADVPLQDAQRAMRIIRARAERYGFDPQKVAAVGFSAGGHLAASLATGFAEPVYAPRDDLDRLDARPAAAGLIYPVILMSGPHAHQGSATFLLGRSPDAELLARRSPAQRVTADTPPIFLAHTLDDPIVPMQNSLAMLEAMQAQKRPAEAHFFPKGGHGFGLGPAGSRAAEWPGLFASWLDRCFVT
jgi:acetyl esterase/lipase